MGYQIRQSLREAIWAVVRAQHGVIARGQLLELGVHPQAIKHRLATGRLHRIHRGVYAVGRPELTQKGRWMAAVLACGRDAVLSHSSAAAHWKIRRLRRGGPIQTSLVADVFRQVPGIRVHRRPTLTDREITIHDGIPITTPARTLIDLATVLTPPQLEAAVNEADVLDLTDPETLRRELELRKGQPGVRLLRDLLDRHTFRLTDSELERRFLRLVEKAGLPVPRTQERIAGRVDFHWPELNLVVETDGLRYHRTASKQAIDLARDQAHAVAGRERLRFSHSQIRYQPDSVLGTLLAVAGRARPAA